MTQKLYRPHVHGPYIEGGCSSKETHAVAEHSQGISPGTCNAETRDRAGDLQIFSLTLSQLSYRGSVQSWRSPFITLVQILLLGSPWIRSVQFWRGPHGKGLLGSGCRGLKNFKPRLAQRVCSCTCPHGGATCWNMMMEQWGKCGK